MKRITIEFIDTSKFNPFNAEPEEMLAYLMDENALITDSSKINGISAREYCDKFYQKRRKYLKKIKKTS